MTRLVQRGARGFTLIEVLVALAIVVVGVAALLSTLSSAADTTAYLRDKTLAQWVGLNQIATVRLAVQPPATGTTQGDLEYAGRKWHYEQQVQDLKISGLRRIDVRVVLARDDKTFPADTWTATASSILGSALATPNGILPDWDTGSYADRPAPAGANGAVTGGTPGTTTGTTGAAAPAKGATGTTTTGSGAVQP